MPWRRAGRRPLQRVGESPRVVGRDPLRRTSTSCTRCKQRVMGVSQRRHHLRGLHGPGGDVHGVTLPTGQVGRPFCRGRSAIRRPNLKAPRRLCPLGHEVFEVECKGWGSGGPGPDRSLLRGDAPPGTQGRALFFTPRLVAPRLRERPFRGAEPGFQPGIQEPFRLSAGPRESGGVETFPCFPRWADRGALPAVPPGLAVV